jgi:hypothetical protein
MSSVTSIGSWEALRERVASRLGAGWKIEPAKVLQAVATHREYWRPTDVRVLLLAESHVMTAADEVAVSVPLENFGHPRAPVEFVRLVYCLGYGEPGLLSSQVDRNAGTPQFWKLFAAAADDLADGHVLKTVERDLSRRVRAKLAVLDALKARGVWLLDASPLALYRSGGGKPTPAELRAALSAAWDGYAREVVRELAPRAVMVIGKTVHVVLSESLRQLLPRHTPVGWICQPQAHVPSVEHRRGMERLREMVCRYGSSS